MTENLLALNQQEQDRLENESYYDSTATHAGAAAGDWTEEEDAAYQNEARALWEEYQQEYWTPVSHNNNPADPGNLTTLLQERAPTDGVSLPAHGYSGGGDMS
jgi:hypothetical protein